MKMELNIYFAFYILSVVLAAVSQILLKKSALKEHDVFWKEYVNPYVIGGYALTGSSMLLTVLAFRGMEYKNGPIIESLGYILVMHKYFFHFISNIYVPVMNWIERASKNTNFTHYYHP